LWRCGKRAAPYLPRVGEQLRCVAGRSVVEARQPEGAQNDERANAGTGWHAPAQAPNLGGMQACSTVGWHAAERGRTNRVERESSLTQGVALRLIRPYPSRALQRQAYGRPMRSHGTCPVALLRRCRTVRARARCGGSHSLPKPTAMGPPAGQPRSYTTCPSRTARAITWFRAGRHASTSSGVASKVSMLIGRRANARTGRGLRVTIRRGVFESLGDRTEEAVCSCPVVVPGNAGNLPSERDARLPGDGGGGLRVRRPALLGFPCFGTLLEVADQLVGIVRAAFGDRVPAPPDSLERLVLHGATSAQSSMGVTRAGTNSPRRVLTIRMCSYVLALAMCRQFQVSRKSHLR